MTEGEFMAQIGPFLLKPSDWRTLETAMKIFCEGNDGTQIFFAIRGTEQDGEINTESLVILPIRTIFIEGTTILDSFKLEELAKLLSKMKDLLAFGYVTTQKTIELNENDEHVAVKVVRAFGRPIYYIVLNSEFDREVRRVSPDAVSRILQPVDDEDENEPHDVKIVEDDMDDLR